MVSIRTLARAESPRVLPTLAGGHLRERYHLIVAVSVTLTGTDYKQVISTHTALCCAWQNSHLALVSRERK